MPIMSSFVLDAIVASRNIRRARSRFECFADVVAIANELQCPVMSNNSDYYLMDIKAGYIPFSSLRPPNGDRLILAPRIVSLAKLEQRDIKDTIAAMVDNVSGDVADQLAALDINQNVDGQQETASPVKALRCRKFFLSSLLEHFKQPKTSAPLRAEVLPLFAVIVGNSKRTRTFKDDYIWDMTFRLPKVDFDSKFTLNVNTKSSECLNLN